jgi:O-antigen biosynthesis protein
MRRLVRLSGFLFLLFKDTNLRRAVRAVLYYLRRVEEMPPDEFSHGIRTWCQNIVTLQPYLHHSLKTSQLPDELSLLDNYPKIIQRIEEETASFHSHPLITLIIPVYDDSFDLLDCTLRSIRQQFYQRMEIYILGDSLSQPGLEQTARRVFGDSNRPAIRQFENLSAQLGPALEKVLDECKGEFIGFLSLGDTLSRDATLEVTRLVNRSPDLDVIYSDESKRAGKDTIHRFYKPGWSRDLFLSMNYTQNFLCCRTASVRIAGGFHGRFESDIKYDLVLRIIEKAERIQHIPRILYHEEVYKKYYPGEFNADLSFQLHKEALANHLKRAGIEADVEDGIFKSSFRVRRKIVGQPQVSIIIPTKDKVELLKQCIDSIELNSTYRNYEIIVIDNGSIEAETLNYFATFAHRVLHYPDKFNYSKINNFGAQHAAGEHLLFLNNDTQVIAPDWLQSLLEHSQREEVGGVGAKLLYPNGRIQHAGMVLVAANISGHTNSLTDLYDHGDDGLVDVVRNFNSVTGACLMMRASVFKEIGGFNESLPVTYNDVDLCLKARARGYLVVYTPFALLYHYEGVSKSSVMDNVGEVAEIRTTSNGKPVTYRVPVPEGQAEEVRKFYARWEPFIQNDVNFISKKDICPNSS